MLPLCTTIYALVVLSFPGSRNGCKETLGSMILDLDEIKAFQSNVTKRARVCKCARKKKRGGG